MLPNENPLIEMDHFFGNRGKKKDKKLIALFNKHTCNGMREMTVERFIDAVKEIKK